MKYLVLITVIILQLVATTAQAADHPAWGYPPNELPKGYGTAGWGLPDEMSYGDITFSAPYPDPSTLSDSEKYIISGTQSSEKGGGLAPWRRAIFNAVNGIYVNTGNVPPELTPGLLSAVMDVNEATASGSIDQFRSPITGEFPRLDASYFSPGQVYIHLLTEGEKQYFAGTYQVYQDNWFDGISRNPATGEMMPIEITGGVFYIRIYGESDVIYEGIEYVFREL